MTTETPDEQPTEAANPTDRIVLKFGNPSPQMRVVDEQGNIASIKAPHLDQSVTTVQFAPHVSDEEHTKLALSTDNDRMLSMIGQSLAPAHKRWAIAVRELEDIVGIHAGGAKPTWVACSDEMLQKAVAKYFGCDEGEPTMLFTNAGRDAVHAQHMTTGAQPAAFNYMALTASTTPPAAGDTTLTGEITTAGGGLLRKQCTYAHTAGTNTSTLTATFTANGSDSLPVVVAQVGVFNAASVGTIAYHTALSATATLTTSGDNLTNTETVTAG